MEVSHLTLDTKYGCVTFDIWDLAGQPAYSQLNNGYYIHAECAIIMFDVMSMITYENVEKWYKSLAAVCSTISTVLVANKVDVKERAVPTKKVRFHEKYKIPYVEMSAKTNVSIDKPYLILLKKLTGHTL